MGIQSNRAMRSAIYLKGNGFTSQWRVLCMKYQSAHSSVIKLVARGMEGRILTMKNGVGKLAAASFLGKIK